MEETELKTKIESAFKEEIFKDEKVISLDPFSVMELRGKKSNYSSLSKYPGIYKWWADKDFIRAIFKKDADEMKLEKSGDYYCIYVGKASGQSLRERLGMHYRHTKGVSAIRKEISKAIGKDENSDDVSEWVDKLFVSIKGYDFKIGSCWTDIAIEAFELMEINNEYDHPCNKSQKYKKTEA